MKSSKKVMSDMVAVSRPKKTTVQKKSPVYETRYKEQEIENEPEEILYDNESQDIPRKMGCSVWFIGIICTAILAVVFGGFIATAKITIGPKQFTGMVDTTINLSQTIGSGTIRFFTATKDFTEERVIPGQIVTIKDSYATGIVRFYNASSTAKTIPAKTVIKSSNASGQIIMYQTKKSIVVPAMKLKIPGQQEVIVIAQKAGSDANIVANDFILATTITGITARSIKEITGGAQGSDKVADPVVVSQAKNDLTQTFALTTDLVARMVEEIPKDMIALPVTFVDSIPVISIESQHDDGVHVVARKTVTIIMVQRTEFARFIGDKLNVTKDIKLSLDTLNDLVITTSVLASPNAIPIIVPVRVSGNSNIHGQINEDNIIKTILGKSRGEVRTLLTAIPEIDHFTINIFPPWRRVLPAQAGKVRVVVR